MRKEAADAETGCSSVEWKPAPEQKALMDRLDELDAMIKPLEDEYRRTAAELTKIGGKDVRGNLTGNQHSFKRDLY